MAFPRSGGQGGGKRVRISEENVIEMVERESGEVRRRRSLAEVREVGERVGEEVGEEGEVVGEEEERGPQYYHLHMTSLTRTTL